MRVVISCSIAYGYRVVQYRIALKSLSAEVKESLIIHVVILQEGPWGSAPTSF